MLVGILVGLFVAIVVGSGLVVCYSRRRQRHQDRHPPSHELKYPKNNWPKIVERGHHGAR